MGVMQTAKTEFCFLVIRSTYVQIFGTTAWPVIITGAFSLANSSRHSLLLLSLQLSLSLLVVLRCVHAVLKHCQLPS